MGPFNFFIFEKIHVCFWIYLVYLIYLFYLILFNGTKKSGLWPLGHLTFLTFLNLARKGTYEN